MLKKYILSSHEFSGKCVILHHKSDYEYKVHIFFRGVPIWEFWVLPIPIIFLSKSTDTDHWPDIDLAYVKQL